MPNNIFYIIHKIYIVVVIAVLFIIVGCSVDAKLAALNDRYIENQLQYNQLLRSLRSLDGLLEIKGVVMKKPVLLNLREGYQIEFQVATKKWPDYKSNLLHLLEISEYLQIAYANLDENNTLWIIQNGGGVLGSDFGFLIMGEVDITAYKSRLHSYKNIEGFSGAYSIVY